MISRVLFIGQTNTRRSRFAEGLFNSLARQHQIPWKAFSRGLHAPEVMERIDPALPAELERWQIATTDLAASKMPLTVRDLMSSHRVILWSDAVEDFSASFPNWCHKAEGWDTGHEGLESLPWIAESVLTLLNELHGQPLPRPDFPGSAQTQSLIEADASADTNLEAVSAPAPSADATATLTSDEIVTAAPLAEVPPSNTSANLARKTESGSGNSFRHSARRSTPGQANLPSEVSSSPETQSQSTAVTESEANPWPDWSPSAPLPRSVKAALRLRRTLS